MTSNHGKFDADSPERIARGIPRRHALTDGRSFQARELSRKSGLMPGQVAHLARLGFTREQILTGKITPFNAHEHTPGAPVQPRELYLLVGATVVMARYWAREREIPESEVGRTIFTTSMDESVMRGRRGPITIVHAADDGRDFYEGRILTGRERGIVRDADRINAIGA